MSLPVPYLPGDVRHDIRNTVRGEFLFVPTELICQAFQFILATGARRYGVGIVAYAMMCSHIHLLVVDMRDQGVESDVPGFRRFVRSTFAQFVKHYWGRERGKIFCPDSIGSSIKLLDFSSIEEAIAYIETNPMEAGMERSPELMKGAVSLREWLYQPQIIERPETFFQCRTWEDEEVLELVVPPCVAQSGHTVDSFYDVTRNAVQARLKAIMHHRKRAGLKARPLWALRRLRPEHGRGKSSADHSEALLACKDPVRAAIEFGRIRSFRRHHALALKRLRGGDRDAVFPPGTYLAAKRYGVKVQGGPDHAPSQ